MSQIKLEHVVHVVAVDPTTQLELEVVPSQQLLYPDLGQIVTPLFLAVLDCEAAAATKIH